MRPNKKTFKSYARIRFSAAEGINNFSHFMGDEKFFMWKWGKYFEYYAEKELLKMSSLGNENIFRSLSWLNV